MSAIAIGAIQFLDALGFQGRIKVIARSQLKTPFSSLLSGVHYIEWIVLRGAQPGAGADHSESHGAAGPPAVAALLYTVTLAAEKLYWSP